MSVEISILIPTFRRPTMLRRAVEACFRQEISGHAVEIVVVDNCPDRSAEAMVGTLMHDAPHSVRYVHEPKAGVSHARNAAVMAAQGTYLVFLDDDETPHAGWLDALHRVVTSGFDAAFGPVLPVFETAPDARVARLAGQVFTRDLRLPAGSDITSRFAYVGTGNSIFARRCVEGRAVVFDPRFGLSGGEDTMFIAALVREGRRLGWAADAIVDEFVPHDRTDLNYLVTRRFYSGRNRVLALYRPTFKGVSQALLWMGVGLVQAGLFGALTLILRPLDLARSCECRARMSGGLGKLLWWKPSSLKRYGGDAAVVTAGQKGA